MHPFGKKLLGESHIVHKLGNEHKKLRVRMIPYFSSQLALSIYAQAQQTIMLKHIAAWERLFANSNKPIALKNLVRKMNLESSQTAFVGPYLSPVARQQLIKDYHIIGVGWMSLPFDLPGFAFRSARLAMRRQFETLWGCATESKARMASGNNQPTCLVDFMMAPKVNGVEELSCEEVSTNLFGFLFAAQDASTSPLVWAVTYLESHPDILARVRDEVAAIWSSGSGLILAEQLPAMEYTHAVGLEVLRIRPPGTLFPHIAVQDFQLTESYTIPKGTIVFPSIFDSSFQGFSDPDRFDPERFLKGREEHIVYKRNFLVFGSGAHRCVAQNYAIKTLVLFIVMFTARLNFKRHRTDGCDDIVYAPTIYPKDDCMVYLSTR